MNGKQYMLRIVIVNSTCFDFFFETHITTFATDPGNASTNSSYSTTDRT